MRKKKIVFFITIIFHDYQKQCLKSLSKFESDKKNIFHRDNIFFTWRKSDSAIVHKPESDKKNIFLDLDSSSPTIVELFSTQGETKTLFRTQWQDTRAMRKRTNPLWSMPLSVASYPRLSEHLFPLNSPSIQTEFFLFTVDVWSLST